MNPLRKTVGNLLDLTIKIIVLFCMIFSYETLDIELEKLQ